MTDKTKQINIRLSQEDFEKLDDVCQKEGKSISSMLRILLKGYLENETEFQTKNLALQEKIIEQNELLNIAMKSIFSLTYAVQPDNFRAGQANESFINKYREAGKIYEKNIQDIHTKNKERDTQNV